MKTMETFKEIVLATDGTESARSAVDAAIELAGYSGATVHVVDVWNLAKRHRHGKADLDVRASAARLVKETVDRLAAQGVLADETVYRSDEDHVAAAIAQIARLHHADLVIVGSRGLSDWRSLVGHSVSHAVLASVDCPVLIVRARPGGVGPIHRIVVAVAGGRDIEPAVRACAAVASSHPCQVAVLHVQQSIVAVQGFAYVETDEEAEATLGEAHHQLEARGVLADRVLVPPGPVAPAIARAAEEWNADLIVTGSGRMGDTGSLLLGSVSHGLLHRSDIPVLVAARAS